MTNLQLKILECLYQKNLNCVDLTKRINRFRIHKIKKHFIEQEIDWLEDENYIENLSDRDLEFLDNGTDDSGTHTNFTDLFRCTRHGEEIVETVREDRRRFYMPFYFTGAVSIVSLLISFASLILSIHQAFYAQ